MVVECSCHDLHVACFVQGFGVGGTGGVPIAHGAVYGAGVYSATGPNIAMDYMSGGNQLVLARGLVGRSQGHDPDSWSPNPEWLVFKTAEQLLPCYVVYFTGNPF
jgi:hypothetical protein